MISSGGVAGLLNIGDALGVQVFLGVLNSRALFTSEVEYSRPTVLTSGFWASIISSSNSTFSASLVPVT